MPSSWRCCWEEQSPVRKIPADLEVCALPIGTSSQWALFEFFIEKEYFYKKKDAQ